MDLAITDNNELDIERMYHELQAMNLCQSAYDFSVNYLGKSKSYYSVLKARNEKPSVEAWVTLDYMLRQQMEWFKDDDDEQVRRTMSTLTELQQQVSACIDHQCKSRIFLT